MVKFSTFTCIDDKFNRSLFIIRPTVIFGDGNRGNVYNLFNQIASGRFLMIGRGENKKSMAYVANVAAFPETCIVSEENYGLFNYLDQVNKITYVVF